MSNTSPNTLPKKAMVLAAGLGKRMRPITDRLPKPLVQVAKHTLIDRIIDRLEDVGIEEIIVNTHHLGHLLQQHLERREKVKITFSAEEVLLETGGGLAKARADGLLGNDPILAINGDTLWLNGHDDALLRLGEQWDPSKMDCLMLLHSTVDAYGYSGNGDFNVDPLGGLVRRKEREIVPWLFTGIQILKPSLFDDAPEGAFSLNVIYDRVLEQDRLFGVVHDGEWFHIGTPEGLAQAERYMQVRYAGIKHR